MSAADGVSHLTAQPLKRRLQRWPSGTNGRGVEAPLRVLYINHTGMVSGAEHSLFELLRGLPDSVTASALCPSGPAALTLRDLGLPVYDMAPVNLGFRLRIAHTPVMMTRLFRQSRHLAAIIRRTRPHLVHANSTRAGLLCLVPTSTPNVPVLVHIRDCLPASPSGRLLGRLLSARADIIICNSAYVASAFEPNGSGAQVHVVHNPVDLARFNPALYDHMRSRRGLGLAKGDLVVALVAQITPWKAQADAISMTASLRQRWPNLRLLLVGEPKFVGPTTRYDNQAYAVSLRQSVETLGLEGSVLFLGERSDIPTILSAADLLIVPSWEEPFGRTVIEAMAMAVPVVATSVGGPPEIIEDSVDGVLLPPKRPEVWAEVVADLLADPRRRADLGRRGREKALARFSREQHVAAMLEIYRQALGLDPDK